MQPHQQSKLGKYRFVSPLGRGGMGIVYLAYDEQTERYVAIKKLLDGDSATETFEKLRKEARFLAKVNHHNIVQLHDFIEEDDSVAIVMEYVKGLTLSHYLNTRHYSLAQALRWLYEMASALDCAHRSGIIHRDLKADNIIINEAGEVRVTDFGIARGGDDTKTQEALIKGSPTALAPEQVRGTAVTTQSDMFSFGVLAYQLFYGGHPFGPTDNAMALLHRIAYEDVIVQENAKAGLPVPLAQLITRLLDKQPENRPSAREVVSVIASISMPPSSPDGATFQQTIELAVETVQPRKCASDAGHSKPIKQWFWGVTVMTAASLAIIVVVWSLGLGQSVFSTQEKFVAVLPPRLTVAGDQDASLTPELQATARITRHAIEQTVIEARHFYLIPSREFDNVQVNAKSLGTSLGADLLVEPDILCDDRRCEITLSAIEKGSWSVVAKRRWPVIASDTSNVYSSTQQNLARLIGLTPNDYAYNQWMSEKGYLTYLEMDQRFNQSPSSYPEVLPTTAALIEKAPKYLPLYQLYSSAALHGYYDTNQSHYLDDLKATLTSAGRLLPDSPELDIQWFWLAFARNDTKGCRQYLARLESEGMPQDITFRLRAKVERLDGNIDKAIDFYERALRLRPDDETRFHLAKTQWQGGYNLDAKKTLQTLFDFDARNFNGLTLAAQIALAEGNLATAVNYYEKLLPLQRDSYAYSNLGLIYMLRGNYPKAREHFQEAVRLSTNYPTDLLNLADVEFLLGNRSAAQALYEKVISAAEKPGGEMVDIQLSLSQAYAHLGQFRAAIEITQDQLTKDSENVIVLFNAALVYTLAEEQQSAMVFVDKARKSGIGDIWFLLPWFKPLCKDPGFFQIFQGLGDANLCH